MRRQSCWPLLVFLLVGGCTPQLRAAALAAEAEQRMLEVPRRLNVELKTVRQWLESLDVVALACFRVTEPCLSEGAIFSNTKLSFCLLRGGKLSCFVAEQIDTCVSIAATSGEARVWELEQLVKRFDPQSHAALRSAVSEEVEARMASDEREVGAWSFTANAGVLFGIPNGPSPSFMARAGVRRWLSPYLIVSLAPGYERRLISIFVTAQDSVSLTGKVEFSWFDEDAQKMVRRLNLPLLSGFVGLTTSLGLFPEQVIASQRVFAGLQLLFLFLEAGVAVGGSPGASPRPSFYLAVGLGI